MLASSSRWTTGVLVALALLVCSGCFTVDGTLNADGSGAIVLRYRFLPEHATAASETRRFSSPWVVVTSIAPDGDMVVLEATVRDVTKLDSTDGLRGVRVSRERIGAEERLRVSINDREVRAASRGTWPDPADVEVAAAKLPPARISLTMPGAIRRASGNAIVQGRTATWRITMPDFARARWTKLSLRYRVT